MLFIVTLKYTTMNKILHEINMNILKHKIKLIRQDIYTLDRSHKENNEKLNDISGIYDKLLFKDKPVGSAFNAIKHNRA